MGGIETETNIPGKNRTVSLSIEEGSLHYLELKKWNLHTRSSFVSYGITSLGEYWLFAVNTVDES